MSASTCIELDIVGCFEDIARRHAESIAIRSCDGDLTYAELQKRVNAIANRIRPQLMIAPKHVAILVEQGPDAIVGILGALKAGGVYVPLDPNDPVGRVRFILKDSQASVIVTSRQQLPVAQEAAPAGCSIIVVDDNGSGVDDDMTLASEVVDPAAPAYVFYTSGSTGEPKGVVQSHRNLLHFARTYANTMAIDARDRVSLLYTMSFSAANMDIYGALLRGATLCPYDVRRQGADGLSRWIREQRITVLHAVPTLFRHIIATSSRDDLATIRAVDLGGEPVFGGDVRMCRGRLNDNCIIINHYAATEAGVIAQHIMRVGDRVPDGLLPVGRAAEQIEIGLVRNQQKLTDANEVGEIVISSPRICLGYWQRPHLTQLAFEQSAAGDDMRSYKTGDLGRLDASGALQVLGRRDSRVKIRGHSVDLAEVEAALRGVQNITSAAVVCIKDESGGEHNIRLVAYVVAKNLATGTIRGAIADRLPRYMVPAEIHLLNELPKTATGKIDRALLSGPYRPQAALPADAADQFTDPVERTVADVFRHVLGIEGFERNEGFFDLGGDSLKLVQLQLEFRRTLGREAPLNRVLEDSTVTGIVRALRQSGLYQRSHLWPVLIPLREGGSLPPLFLVHGINGQAFVSPAFLRALGEDQPVYAFQARGLERGERSHARVVPMASDYIEAMRAIQPQGPYALVGICGGGIVAHEMACRLTEAGESLSLLLLIDPPDPPSTRGLFARIGRLSGLYLNRLPAAIRPLRQFHETLEARVQRRNAEGRAAFNLGDSESLQRAVRVAADLRIALLRHRLGLYRGTVHVIGSAARATSPAWKDGAWRNAISGSIHRTIVSQEHSEVLDPRNDKLVTALHDCLVEAYGSLTSPGSLCPQQPQAPDDLWRNSARDKPDLHRMPATTA